MEITVKNFIELTTEEIYEILRLRSEVFVVEQDSVYQDIDGRDNHSVHIFIKNDNGILSYLRVIKPGVMHAAASIGRVLTRKEARGHGLARALMLKGIDVAKSMGAGIEIEAQTYLKEFYESLGFMVCSDEFIYEGRPHISMKM